jgi:hypothetical protein
VSLVVLKCVFFFSKRFVTLKVKWRNSARRIFSALPFISGTPDTSQLSTVSGNGVTDTLESNTILIYSDEFIHTEFRQQAKMIKWLIKSNGEGNGGAVNKVNLKDEVAVEVWSKSKSKIFFANSKLY